MIWLTWRQFRAQAVAAAGLLLALAIVLVVLGFQMRHDYSALVAGCARTNTCEQAQADFNGRYGPPVGIVGVLLLLTPALIGTFWGAPMIARELETGTCRVAWTQSISRTRWLATKLAVLTAVSAVVAGLFSLLLTWASRPYDQHHGGRFGALTFGARDLTPIGYAVFAFALGVTLGLLVRRTIPAMALTLAVFAGLQVLVPLAVRPHLLPAVNLKVPVSASSLSDVNGFYLDGAVGQDGQALPDTKVVVQGYEIPGAWVLTRTSQLLTSIGRPVDPQLAQTCMTGTGPASTSGQQPTQPTKATQATPGTPASAGDCLSRLHLHFDVSYQPAGRYWPLQLIETAIFLALALALAGLCFRVLPRGLA